MSSLRYGSASAVSSLAKLLGRADSRRRGDCRATSLPRALWPPLCGLIYPRAGSYDDPSGSDGLSSPRATM